MKYMKAPLVGVAAAILFAGFSVGVAYARQMNMDNALSYLQKAKDSLEVADRNKGGHRIRAIYYINKSIDEVQAGINYSAPNY